MAKVNIVKEFKGGSMAKTFLVHSQGEHSVRKIAEITKDSLGAQKLMSQWKWLLDFNLTFPGIFPEVGFFVVNKQTCHYDMEFVDMPTLRDLLIDESHEIEEMIMHDVLKFGSLIAEPQSSKQDKDTYIENKHLKKMIERTQCLRTADFYKSDFIVVNGKLCKNLHLIVKEIYENKELMELLKPDEWFRSHGDFTFQNILTDEYGMKVIDPRGEGADSIYYDISKLYQSCHGKYDLLYDGNYQTKTRTVRNLPHIDFIIHKHVEKFDAIYRELRELIPMYYGLEDEHWEIITKFFEGSHFISMAPFRLKENQEITLTCYAIGVMILNMVVEEFKNES